ncbi:cystatin-A1-like isoform X2 [Siniperca chuatsi]|uniref:cystatin-A1-like isoform X2 n=1 Tax=Siniperca chuatsi TaxID=119488 RepID=UPI001CE125A1|nr:cystatin-A1-like isoform X2 [Siniperca chuatsi]
MIFRPHVGKHLPLCNTLDLVTMADIPGGFTETRNATEEIQKICDQVTCQVEDKTKKKYVEFRAVKYRSQVVAGVNYLVKVNVGGCSYLHLKVFQNLPCYGGEIVLRGVQEDHHEEDPIVPF